jgi:hypothetical protein
MRLPKKSKPEVYKAMLETRPDRMATSRWIGTLQDWAKDEPPPRERKRPNALLRNARKD